MAIINDALPGLERTRIPFAVEADRRQAIALAVKQAAPGDIVLIAGKGHEKTQTTRDGPHPFDDVEVARAVLQAAGYQKRESAPAGGAQ